jgi:hypothetical protein
MLVSVVLLMRESRSSGDREVRREVRADDERPLRGALGHRRWPGALMRWRCGQSWWLTRRAEGAVTWFRLPASQVVEVGDSGLAVAARQSSTAA